MKTDLFFRRSRHLSGFTLMELMVVVIIIGVLAAVAVPLVSKYLRKSKTSEASLNLRKIYDGEVAYFQEDTTLRGGSTTSKSFLTNPRTPASPSNQKQTGNFETNTWQQLKFSADGPVLYSYSTDALGLGTAASFTARAEGDIDNDGHTSLFERVGNVNSQGDVVGGSAIYILDEVE